MIYKKIIQLSLSLIVVTWSFFFFIPLSHSQDVFVRVGNGSGAPGSQSNRVVVALENTVTVRGLQLALLDEKDYLTATGCSTMGRASTLTCDINEKQYGWTILQLYSFGGDLIDTGSGPILSINYAVKGNAPAEECIPLRILRKAREIESKASDGNKIPLNVISESGRFCFLQGNDDEEEDAADNADTSSDESMNDTSANQRSGGGNSLNFSDGTIQPTTSSIPKIRPPTETSPSTSGRQASTSRSAASTQESRRSNPSGTTALLPDSALSPTRVIVSPEAVTLTSGDLIALAPQTINDGRAVEGNYNYEITPPSPIGSIIGDEGLFTAGTNTSPEDIEEIIKVTDTAHENATAFVLMIVAGRKQPSSSCEVSISPSSATLFPEDSITFSAQTYGKKCSEGLYEWKVNSKIGSSINEQGVYKAGRNASGTSTLDIIIVTDTVNRVSTDAIITVSGISPDPLSPQPAGVSGIKFFPEIVIALTIITIVGGIIVIRKFKQ